MIKRYILSKYMRLISLLLLTRVCATRKPHSFPSVVQNPHSPAADRQVPRQESDCTRKKSSGEKKKRE